MALSSTSTLSDALAQLNNNLAWDGNPTRAANYLEAARWLFFNRGQFSMKAGTQLSFETLRDEIKADGPLAKYVAATKTGAASTNFVRGRPV